MDNSVLEKKIKEALEKKAGEIPMDEFCLQTMQTEVFEKIDKEEKIMKFGKWKKVMFAAAAICVLGSVTAFGLGRASSVVSHSSNKEEVYDYGKAVEMQQGYDKMFRFPESFGNGYSFKSAVPQYAQTRDENGNPLEDSVSMYVRYKKEGMADVSLSADRMGLGEGAAPAQTVTLEDGTKLLYSTMVNKFVPPDYVPTEEELAARDAGTLNLAFGSSEIQVMNSASVMWEKDGLSYILFAFGDDLTAEDMLGMAKEAAEF